MFGVRFQTFYSRGLSGPLLIIFTILSLLCPSGAQAALAPGTAVTTAVTLSYAAAQSGAMTSQSNAASFIVTQQAGVGVLPVSATQNAVPDQSVSAFPLQIQNTGNDSDRFDVVLNGPNGWSACLVQDANGSGQYAPNDTMPVTLPVALRAGQSLHCFLRVTTPLPLAQSGSVSIALTSEADRSQTASALATLTAPVQATPPAALMLGWSAQTHGPVLCEATVVHGIAYVGSDDGGLYAIAATPASGATPGTVLWRASTGAAVRCTPAVYTTDKGRAQVSVGNEAGRLCTYSAVSGQLLWSVQAHSARSASWTARPLVSANGSLISVPGDGMGLWTLRTTDGGIRRVAYWRSLRVAGDPAQSRPDGSAWLTGRNGWATEVLNGLPGRRLNLKRSTAGAVVFDPAQCSLLSVRADGRILAFDPQTLQPDPRWPNLITVPAPPTAKATQDEGAPLSDAPSALQAGPQDFDTGVALNAFVDCSPALDVSQETLYVATRAHTVYAVSIADGRLQAGGWPFAPAGSSAARFAATPLVWPSLTAPTPTLYVGDTAGEFYAVPAGQPSQAVAFTPPSGMALPGAWAAAPAASGTGPQDVVVAGNANGTVYGFALR